MNWQGQWKRARRICAEAGAGKRKGLRLDQITGQRQWTNGSENLCRGRGREKGGTQTLSNDLAEAMEKGLGELGRGWGREKGGTQTLSNDLTGAKDKGLVILAEAAPKKREGLSGSIKLLGRGY